MESDAAYPAGEETKAAISFKDALKKSEVVCMICGKGGIGFSEARRKMAEEED
ncbi:hypothetical protein [Geotalea sp. SG265]|uniref:hypothetical protein n=1 Tax=Geotalea sp. SG265 TaxID=2922867 RepID=UPI00325FD8DE